jgi:hypothetical protein
MLEGKEYCNISHMEENQKESVQNIVFLISSEEFHHALNSVFVKGEMSVSLREVSSFHCLNIVSKSLVLTLWHWN